MHPAPRPPLLEEALAHGGPIIVFDDVLLAFDDKVILRNVSFTLQTGHTKVFLGASGAGKSTILRLILGHGMKPVGVGCAVGLITSIAFTRLMKTLLFGVIPTDLLTFALVPLLLTPVAILACYLPARRAMKINPIEALRSV